MNRLHPAFATIPMAHRGLHDIASGRPENSLAAARAAMDAGYGIEIDVQLSADGVAMVFHDYQLDRLTGANGFVRQKNAHELGQLKLRGGTEPIPTLVELFDMVRGRCPVLVEIKDQDGAMGEKVGPLKKALAPALNRCDGPVAVMSFNPHAVLAMSKFAPQVARGLTTCHFSQEDWQHIPKQRREYLRAIPDYEQTGATFISHEITDLGNPRIPELKAKGAIVNCWTVGSKEIETKAREVADNITFEGYLPTIPAT